MVFFNFFFLLLTWIIGNVYRACVQTTMLSTLHPHAFGGFAEMLN